MDWDVCQLVAMYLRSEAVVDEDENEEDEVDERELVDENEDEEDQLADEKEDKVCSQASALVQHNRMDHNNHSMDRTFHCCCSDPEEGGHEDHPAEWDNCDLAAAAAAARKPDASAHAHVPACFRHWKRVSTGQVFSFHK